MQTQLAPEFQDQPDGRQAEAVLRQCVHCGFCNATCPTYKLTGNELDGPRGRIYLMKQVFEGQAPTRTTQEHLDKCIGCRHCESTCPSGVQYHELLAVGQAAVDARVARPWRERLLRALLIKVLPSRWFAPALSVGRALRPMLPSRLQERIPLRPPMAPPAWPDRKKAMHARQILLLKSCVQRGLRPHIDASTARVLDALGIRAGVVRQSGCCGAIQGHLGDLDGARERARRNIDAWWPWVESKTPAEAILINASGCGAWVKDYGKLLADDPAYADKARRIAALAKDPGELLPAWVPTLKRKLGRLPPEALGSFTFHPPCSLSHAQGLSRAGQPGPIEQGMRELGFDVRLALRDSHQCCGAGGAYSLTQPEMSRQLRDQKIQALEETEPHMIASANIGCIVHLQSGTDIPVKHWIEVLDEALTRHASILNTQG
ncbi:glycolate oxidase subunit GlcF [Aquabacterium sp.]|uniref:glycolate oxidase subunit GlcF n=1 Tax=Aquabacterium sp. TaxID=1872578 RepID=UPI002E37C1B8|nr:glycolate oxidase subunit GlcF [Aquabacterium sp.]HEX5311424.1 glycolate oxidase subunit GlcF [Aquabacterium sp.]